MIKQAIKYLLLSFCFINLIYAQNTSNNSVLPIDNNHSIINNAHYLLNYPEEVIKINMERSEETGKSMMINKSSSEEKSRIEMEFFKPAPMVNPTVEKPVKQDFNIVASFRENIRFGGFWEKYAIINFNPSVNLKPAEFISIYANENLSCFVPIAEAKEYIKMLFIHSAAILAIDNSVKLLFNQHDWIANAAGFLVKNLVITLLKDQLNNNNEYKIYNHDSYYFAVSIRF